MSGSVTVPMLLHGEVAVGDRLPELVYDVTATTVVLGALASRDWRPMHHDKDFAVDRNGARDIFLNTPNQAAWFERFLTDWTGPTGRLGRMTFRMLGSVFPGDTMVLSGVVDDVSRGRRPAAAGWASTSPCRWAATPRRTCAARVAVPLDADDNPWSRRGDAVATVTERS